MKYIGLIDCNNFFVSCERVINPALEGRPVVVASNNDGCAVSMSREAKAIGISRSQPLFKIRDQLRKHNVITISGHHKLYGNLSARVMSTIESVVQDIEIYSIDEAFIHFPDRDAETIERLGREIVTRVRRHVGIPTSLGIASTKTLAKVAADKAKKDKSLRGVCILDGEHSRLEALANIPVGKIWGIGRKFVKRLERSGITMASQLAALSQTEIEMLLNVPGQRTWRELNGIPCIDHNPESSTKKQICTTRTFAPSVTDLPTLEQAITRFITIASRKLRRQHSAAKGVSVFLQTNSYLDENNQYSNSAYHCLEEPTDDQLTLVTHCLALLRKIYSKGLPYRRAGVYITETIPITHIQPSLFSSIDDRKKRKRLNTALDDLNEDATPIHHAVSIPTPTRHQTTS
ncbi:MAG: Y-family DNA polymerase [Muribaculaceae bacterium]|nr:Y-family DNA polymerase [Muribaculaceae bacterium]